MALGPRSQGLGETNFYTGLVRGSEDAARWDEVTSFDQKSRLSEVAAVLIKIKQRRGKLCTRDLGEVRDPLAVWWMNQQRDQWFDLEPRHKMRGASGELRIRVQRLGWSERVRVDAGAALSRLRPLVLLELVAAAGALRGGDGERAAGAVRPYCTRALLDGEGKANDLPTVAIHTLSLKVSILRVHKTPATSKRPLRLFRNPLPYALRNARERRAAPAARPDANEAMHIMHYVCFKPAGSGPPLYGVSDPGLHPRTPLRPHHPHTVACDKNWSCARKRPLLKGVPSPPG